MLVWVQIPICHITKDILVTESTRGEVIYPQWRDSTYESFVHKYAFKALWRVSGTKSYYEIKSPALLHQVYSHTSDKSRLVSYFVKLSSFWWNKSKHVKCN